MHVHLTFIVTGTSSKNGTLLDVILFFVLQVQKVVKSINPMDLVVAHHNGRKLKLWVRPD
jgi:hypothetical protein